MNAYKNYKKRQTEAENAKLIHEVCDEFIEHMDLIVLSVLHTEYGFGAARLERFYREIEKRYKEYTRYIPDNEKVKFGSGQERMDTWVLKRDLKSAGFDYDKIVASIIGNEENGGENEV